MIKPPKPEGPPVRILKEGSLVPRPTGRAKIVTCHHCGDDVPKKVAAEYHYAATDERFYFCEECLTRLMKGLSDLLKEATDG